MSRRLVFLAFTIFALLLGAQSAVAGEHAYNEHVYDETSPLVVLEMMELIHEYHLNQPDLNRLLDGAVYGILDSLGDPYTEYFPGDQIKEFNDALNGDLVGIGIELQAGEQYPYIVRVIPDTPAHRAGLEAGDLLLVVDGESSKGKTLLDVVAKIRGDRSTRVVLTVQRGDQIIDVALQREDIHVPTVKFEMLAGNTGYLKINSFGSRTLDEFDAAVQTLGTLSPQGLIVDLRDNGGGYLKEAVDISGRFLPKGSLVTTIKYGRDQQEEIFTSQEPVMPQVPMVVLVNDTTASAAEILAAALRDHGLAKLEGTTTFGKGVAQSIVPLGNGGVLKLTTAKYMTPSGYDLDLVGLRPDHFVLTRALQKEVAWHLLNPDRPPVLTIDTNTEQVLLNGQKISQDIKIIKRDHKIYLPLRAVLESMLYQVNWQGGQIKVYKGQEPGLVIGGGGSVPLEIIIMEKGISYIPVELLRQLHIHISSVNNQYTLTPYAE